MPNFLKVLLSIPLFFYFNMASPVQEGTLGTRPFVNEHVAVLHENLHIKIDENFKYAKFNIEYHIEASEEGVEIPLLFYASEYYEDFKVTIDGKTIELLKVADLFDSVNEEKFTKFSNLFESNKANSDSDVSSDSSDFLELHVPDFLYFKTNISKGKHIIKVNYTASHWTFKGSWLKSYSFRYALSPAKYWKSFGTLDVTIDASDFKSPISTNINNYDELLKPLTKLSYTSLPVDVLQIEYSPKINSFANFLIDLTPFNIAIVLTLILIIWHLFKIKEHRKKSPTKRIMPIVVIGAVFIPIFFVALQMLLYSIIDYLIGSMASGLSGYGALYQIILIPVVIVIYLLFTVSVDGFMKRSIAKK